MRAFKIVDVFSSAPFLGNPVAVVLDGAELSDAQMQAIAAWTNLSETTFALPAEDESADYRLRIFTPRSELPFAGHPTLGSAFALLDEGVIKPTNGRVVQECGVGLVEITVGEDGPPFALPPASIRDLSVDEIEELTRILGQPLHPAFTPALVDVGARWVVAGLADATAVLATAPDFPRSAVFETSLGVTGISIFGRHASGPAEIEVRSFAPFCGVNEDPVCGSGNGSVAAFRVRAGDIGSRHTYVAAQGARVGRDGQIHVAVIDSDSIMIGGACVISVNGDLKA